MENYKSNTGMKQKIKEPKGPSLLELVSAWSIKDILNKNLYKDQVKRIPDTFSSTTDYLNSFKQPLIEETRADLCSGLESLAQAPACEISRIKFSKNYKPPKKLCYDISTKLIINSDNQGEHYEPESGDLIVLTNVRPRRIEDLIRPGEPFLLTAMVTRSNEDNPLIEIMLSQKLSPDLLSKKNGRIFATYLMNMTTNMRILGALNPNPRSTSLGLIQKVLQYDSAEDIDCSLCFSEESVSVNSTNVLDFIGSFRLDESQKNAVLSIIFMRKCPHQKHNVKLIWGPPGTGKTKTVACLLFLLLKLKCKTLTCAPTNTAVLQVAERLVRLFMESPEYDSYGLGDIVLFGNKKRMKIDDHDELVDVFLEYRCKILNECLLQRFGWKYNLESMISLLDDPRKQYHTYLNMEKRNDKKAEDSNRSVDVNEGCHSGKSTSAVNMKGSKKDNKKHWKEVINQSLMESKEKNKERGKKKDKVRPSEELGEANDSHNKGTTNNEIEAKAEDLMTFEEFLRKKFYSLADSLSSCARNLYTHLPTSIMSLHVAKKIIRLVHLLDNLQYARKRVGKFPELTLKREEILSTLKWLHERFPGINYNGDMWNLCLSNAKLIFCTASSSIKVRCSVDMVIIDEAAQLKECESAIPLQIPGLRNAILVGDDRQLPAMVRSKISDDAIFGRSLFQRLASLGKKKHLLNIQYRMHPSISLFPNEIFYEKRIVDAPNVKEKSYDRSFLKGDMYGSYSFINVSKGKENFDKGHSTRNVQEATVVGRIITKLFKEHLITKQKVSVGVISPYKGQVGLIQERLGKKYANSKQRGFSVSVRSVDGFQGGEEDIIIISTVRCNRNGSVGFLSNHQRTNVALTRARYCLWIVGSGTTLANSETVWRDLVVDAKTRGCYYNVDEETDLNQTAGISQSYCKIDFGSLKFEKARWKVFLCDEFNISAANIKNSKSQNEVLVMLKKLADGWRQLNSRKVVDIAICGVASELLELYKVDEQLYLAWTIDILKEKTKYTQIIKVWDILPASKIPKLAKDLNILFGSYTVDIMNFCKYKSLERNLIVPMSWPLHSVSCAVAFADPAERLSNQLAALNIRENQGEPSSSFGNNVKSKPKSGSGIGYWFQKERVRRGNGLTEILQILGD